MNSILVVIVVILVSVQFLVTDSKCIPFAHLYKDKCYFTLRPAHIRFFRVNFLKMSEATGIENLTVSEKICSNFVGNIHRPSYMNQREYDELQTFVEIRPDFGPRLAVARDSKHLKWLQKKAFLGAGGREGKSYLGNKNYNGEYGHLSRKAYDSHGGSCLLLFYDPSATEWQLPMIVRCDYPYRYWGESLIIRNVICEYNNPQDCEWKPMYDTCFPNAQGQCYFIKHFRKVPGAGQKYPAHYQDCVAAKVRNQTVECPLEMMDNCTQDCQWAPWRLYRDCTVCGGRQFWTRSIARVAVMPGKKCEGDVDKYTVCECGAGKLEALSLGFMIVIGSVVTKYLVDWYY